MNTAGLTTPQIRVLEYIEECLRLRGVSPTLEEIRAYTGTKNKGYVHAILRGLRDRGRIQWIDRHKRSITILPEGRANHTLPPDLQVKLEKYCAEHNERPTDVLADALALHFDSLEAIGTGALLTE